MLSRMAALHVGCMRCPSTPSGPAIIKEVVYDCMTQKKGYYSLQDDKKQD